MLIDTNLDYKLSIFGDFRKIDATPENVMGLLEVFKNEKFMPNTVKEAQNVIAIGIPGMQLSPNMGNASDRIMLTSPNNEWSIFFGIQRIDIQQKPYDYETGLSQNLNKFLEKSVVYCKTIMNKYMLSANRLAINTSELCSQMKPEEIKEYGNRFSKAIEFYSKNVPIEWSTRFMTHQTVEMDNDNTLINVITTLGRFQGQRAHYDKIDHIDTLKVDFDINTSPENKRLFSVDDIKTFCDFANSTVEKIKGDLG